MSKNKNLHIENKWQKIWKEKKVFESKINNSKEKFFGNEAYPYANSVLHIGHGRTYTISDIFLRYQMLKGKNVLHPLGYHISGTPVLAVSDGIKNKDEKKISQVRDAISDYIGDKKEQDKIIKSFENPKNIANFFSTKIEGALRSIGTSHDFSRQFTTGEEIYNKFIEWQYSKLKREGLLKKGKYPILFSPKDENAVGEDDIADGDIDKVGISEMALIKFKLNKFDTLDAYGENENFIRNDLFLEEIKEKKHYIKTSSVFLIDKNNNILFQKPSSKVFNPCDLKSSAGGITKKNEDYFQTAFDELKEELQIEVLKKDLENSISFLKRINGDENRINAFKKYYFIKVDCDLKNYDVKNSEVEELIKISLNDFKKEIFDDSLCKKYSKSIVDFKEEIILNLEEVSNQKPIGINFIKEDLSDDLENEFICCATLRPDSIFGATNLYLNPKNNLIKISVGNENWIICEKSFTKIQNQFSNVKFIENVSLKYILSKSVMTPILNKLIRIYEADFCDENHGTGIVYSSPADSPQDYISLFETKFPGKKLSDFNHESLNLKPITKTFDKQKKEIKYKFDIPAYSKLIDLKIENSKDIEKLETAKKELYKEAHFGAVMINCTEEFDGTPLKNNVAFEKTKNKLKQLKLAEEFYETTRRAKTRGGDDVVVANLEGQWFLDYSDINVKNKAKELLNYMSYLPNNLKETQNSYIEWAKLRPCARKRGLGTKLPYDKSWVIEPLSDSTIYQMLYIIIKKIREHKIDVKDLDNEFFDYVFFGK